MMTNDGVKEWRWKNQEINVSLIEQSEVIVEKLQGLPVSIHFKGIISVMYMFSPPSLSVSCL